MKICFLGGTFDPPHMGHLKIALECLKQCQKFIFIPSKQSPHKKNPPFCYRHIFAPTPHLGGRPKLFLCGPPLSAGGKGVEQNSHPRVGGVPGLSRPPYPKAGVIPRLKMGPAHGNKIGLESRRVPS